MSSQVPHFLPVNQQDTFRNTELHKAVYKGDVASIRTLLRNPRIDASLTNWEGHTPMESAATHGELAAIEMLLEHSPHQDVKKAMGLAARSANIGVFRYLFQFEHDKTAAIELLPQYVSLAHLIARDEYVMAMELIDLGFDVTKPGKDGLSPLSQALLFGYYRSKSVTTALLENGASLEQSLKELNAYSQMVGVELELHCLEALILRYARSVSKDKYPLSHLVFSELLSAQRTTQPQYFEGSRYQILFNVVSQYMKSANALGEDLERIFVEKVETSDSLFLWALNYEVAENEPWCFTLFGLGGAPTLKPLEKAQEIVETHPLGRGVVQPLPTHDEALVPSDAFEEAKEDGRLLKSPKRKMLTMADF